MREGQSVQNLNVSLKQEILKLEAEEKDLRALLDQHRAHCLRNTEDSTQGENLGHETFYTFGQDLNLDGGALTDIEDNIDKADATHIVVDKDLCMKEEKRDFRWQLNDSHENFSYFGTNFDLVDTSCGNQSMSTRFIGVDTRFIML